MNFEGFLKNPGLKKAAVTFASSYAKRMMEGRYTRLMETQVGQRLVGLNRPSKLAIEFGLNTILGYLSTKEDSLTKSPIAAFLWEVGKDAPSEIAKRMLNGEHHQGTRTIDVETAQVSDAEKQTALEGLLRMNPADLATFLTWLEKASPEERQKLAEWMASLTDEEQKKIVGLTPEQAAALFAATAEPAAPPKPRPPEVQADLDAAHQRLDEELRRRQEKGKG